MTLIDILRAIHITAGATALLTFLLPMLLPKGGRAHRRIGWVFVTAMMGLCASAGPLAIYRFATAGSRGESVGAAFLFYIAVLSFASVWNGIRILRFKGTGRHSHPLDLGVSGGLAALGLGTMIVGALLSAPLLVIFGLVGVLSGLSDIRHWLNPAKERMHWWFQHMGGMIGASIAALTAFSVLNAGALGVGRFSLVAWLLPTAVFVPVSSALRRHYRRKFGLTPAARPEVGLVAAPNS